MTAVPDPSLLAELAMPMRLAAAMATWWFGSMLALVVAQRSNAGDARVQRSWIATAGTIVGACLWAGQLNLALAMTGASDVPLAGATLALVLSITGAGATLAGGLSPRRVHHGAAVAAGALLLMAGVATWAQALAWKPDLLRVAAVGVLAAMSQGLVVWMLLRWQRAERESPWSRSAVFALLPAVALALPLAVMGGVGGVGAWPSPGGPGAELLLALLSAGAAVLALQAGRMERHLVGQHQMLGAQLQQATAHLQRTPLHDPLTGLLSRIGLESALRKAAQQAEGQAQQVALLAIGLDGFKSVNDSYGHALGDSVLREVARRLVDEAGALLATSRLAGQMLARLGGDEFVLVLQGHLDRQAIGRAAGRLLEVLDGPLQCDGYELQLSASIGVACFPEDGGASKLIARANAAMQAAKAAGGSTYMTFEPRMQDDARDRHELLRDLRQAIEGKQLELFYQPKIDARSGQVTAAEALLRWHHPVRGTLSPEVFIPLAERHGLIGALGNWVIEDACRQARVWRERGLKMRVAINLSVFQMRQNDLVERIQAALKRHGVNPSRLTCEITESVAMEDTQVTQRTFERLGQAGIHLSIDDFGTGYSSLSYLRRLPATELKIDRSFVMDLDSNADARAIVDAVLKLAHAIGLKVVAEGVENIRQRDILLQLGCDEFQGYLFARPMSARSLLLWAVEDQPAKNAFRASLFAENDVMSSVNDPGL
jgi:diguanylate cyclase (GGDEF)-like protein